MGAYCLDFTCMLCSFEQVRSFMRICADKHNTSLHSQVTSANSSSAQQPYIHAEAWTHT
eukprot:c18874_g1_i2 orf=234-410(-)